MVTGMKKHVWPTGPTDQSNDGQSWPLVQYDGRIDFKYLIFIWFMKKLRCILINYCFIAWIYSLIRSFFNSWLDFIRTSFFNVQPTLSNWAENFLKLKKNNSFKFLRFLKLLKILNSLKFFNFLKFWNFWKIFKFFIFF